jgi:quercetin dioxygenase-like cupin family protein
MQSKYRFEKWKEFYPPNIAMLRNILVSEGYLVYQWSDTPKAYYGPHKHPEEQTHWVVSGILELNIAGFGSVVLEAGDRDFMPADTYHTAEVLGDQEVLYLVGEKRR